MRIEESTEVLDQDSTSFLERAGSFVSRYRLIIAILLVALLSRTAWLIIAQPLPVSDFNQYLGNARDLVDHGRYGYPEPTAYRLPLYPLVLAGFLLVWDSVTWLAFGSVLFSSALCLLVYLVVSRVGGSTRTALLAALICALFPQFILFAPVLASEHLLAVLILSSFLVATTDRLGPWLRLALAGLLVGAAALTRGDGAIYGLIVLVYAVRMSESSSDLVGTWPVRLRQTVVFGIAAVLVLAPWVIRNEIVIGGMGGNAGQTFWYGHNPQEYGFIPLGETPMADLEEQEVQDLAWELAFDYIKENPFSLVESTISGTAEIFAPSRQSYGVFWSSRTDSRALVDHLESIYPALVALSIAGAWFLTITPALGLLNVNAVGRRMLLLVGVFLFATWFFYGVVFLGNPRYRYVSDIFLCMAAAGVLTSIRRSRPSQPQRRLSGPVVE